MTESQARAFATLFESAYRKCFARALTAPLTEAESHHLSVEITERTGLPIGWKSLKNYSHFLLDRSERRANPSASTLDTLARYVADAPVANERERKKGQRHYSYWFRYLEALQQRGPSPLAAPPSADHPGDVALGAAASQRRLARVAMSAAAVALIALLAVAAATHRDSTGTFTDDFDELGDAALANRGWRVQSKDSMHWAQRAIDPGHLTLFTLRGDNWPQAGTAPQIADLLLRRAPSGCFVAELRLSGFVPKQNWQQAGLLLADDTALTAKSLRVSLAYNDFAGGFPSTREIIIQAAATLGEGSGKPEELAHDRLFALEPGLERAVVANLASVTLRVEKQPHRVRLLYSAGPMANAAFREVVERQLDLRPSYIGIFALKGFVSEADDAPVAVDRFRLMRVPCEG